MGYEIDDIEEINCKCGKGKIKKVTQSNDWNQIYENIIIDCEECNKNYEIIKETHCPKPKHEHTMYFLKDKNTNEKIELDI